MKRLTSALCALALALPGPAVIITVTGVPAHAQSNDNDYTPLNSRIRRKRQFPTDLPMRMVDPSRLSSATRSRNRNMVSQFGRCLWDRGNEKGLDLLARTDFGFVSFGQLGMDYEDAQDLYPIKTCLRRVANSSNSGVQLRYDSASIRRWYLEAAYLDIWPDGPEWIVPGNEIGTRSFPLSEMNGPVLVAMDFADCVVAEDPIGADYFYRTGEETDEEQATLRALVPAISLCVPNGQQMEIDPVAMRAWLGEGLWHAANNNEPAAPETPQEAAE